jgi:hypothetical protein
LKLSLAGDAVDRRNEAGEIEVDLGGFNGGLGCLDLSFGGGDCRLGRQIVLNGVVQILLAGGLLPREGCVAVDVKFGAALNCFGVGELGLGLCQLSLGLVKCRLEGTRINLEEQLSFFDERAFLVALPQ